jgi:hypothetical protein
MLGQREEVLKRFEDLQKKIKEVNAGIQQKDWLILEIDAAGFSSEDKNSSVDVMWQGEVVGTIVVRWVKDVDYCYVEPDFTKKMNNLQKSC